MSLSVTGTGSGLIKPNNSSAEGPIGISISLRIGKYKDGVFFTNSMSLVK